MKVKRRLRVMLVVVVSGLSVIYSLLLSAQTHSQKEPGTSLDSIKSFKPDEFEFDLGNEGVFFIDINRYPYISDLSSAVNEIKNFKDLLIQKYAFKSTKKKQGYLYRTEKYLCGRDATADVICERLNLRAEDSLFIYFYGLNIGGLK